MEHLDKYLCCIAAAIAILVAGCVNPQVLQSKDAQGKPTGHPSYILLALIAFIAGVLVCMLQK